MVAPPQSSATHATGTLDGPRRQCCFLHKAAEKSLASARKLGWTVVSMKNDWTTVFEDGGAA